MQVSEGASTFFNKIVSEARETVKTTTIEDEPEDDDTEELYHSVFIKPEETCPIAR